MRDCGRYLRHAALVAFVVKVTFFRTNRYNSINKITEYFQRRISYKNPQYRLSTNKLRIVQLLVRAIVFDGYP